VFRVAVAGHPPPVLAPLVGPAALVDVTVDPPLGAIPDVERSSVEVRIPTGAVSLLYSDGLIERRGESLDAGFTRLLDSVKPVEPELVCATVMGQLIGSSIPDDDVAVLAMRRAHPIGGRP
jgi:sigma-B regulation protein RsbU (phosphoserine phosphatase)